MSCLLTLYTAVGNEFRNSVPALVLSGLSKSRNEISTSRFRQRIIKTKRQTSATTRKHKPPRGNFGSRCTSTLTSTPHKQRIHEDVQRKAPATTERHRKKLGTFSNRVLDPRCARGRNGLRAFSNRSFSLSRARTRNGLRLGFKITLVLTRPADYKSRTWTITRGFGARFQSKETANAS